MIKINLLGEETFSDSQAPLFIAGYVASVVVLVVVCFFLRSSTISQIEERGTEKQNLEGRLAQLKKTTKEVNDLELKQKELANKLLVIAILKRSKSGPVNVLDSINSAVPDKAWLVEMNEARNDMTIKGVALDNQTVATLAKELEKSPYFVKADIDEVKAATSEKVRVSEFILKTKVSYSGRAAVERETEAGAAPGDADSSLTVPKPPIGVPPQVSRPKEPA